MTAIHKNMMIPKNHRLHIDIDLPAEVPAGEAEVTVLVSPKRKLNKARAIECLRALSNAAKQDLLAPDAEKYLKNMRDASMV